MTKKQSNLPPPEPLAPEVYRSPAPPPPPTVQPYHRGMLDLLKRFKPGDRMVIRWDRKPDR